MSFQTISIQPITSSSSGSGVGVFSGFPLDLQGVGGSTLIVHFTAQGSANNRTVFEFSNDGLTWYVPAVRAVGTVSTHTEGTASGLVPLVNDPWYVPISGRYFRVRCSVFSAGVDTVVVSAVNAQTGPIVVEQGTGNASASWAVQGTVADAAAAANNPVPIGGIFQTTPPTYTDGQRTTLHTDNRGSAFTVIKDGVGGTNIAAVGSPSDANTLSGLWVNAENQLCNGVSFDRQRGNVDAPASLVTLTAQGAGTVNGPDQTNFNGRGAQISINITAANAMTLTIHVQGKDPVSGTYYDMLVSSALAATGFTELVVYPGVTATANVAASNVLPRTWRIQAVVTGTSVTATVGSSVIV